MTIAQAEAHNPPEQRPMMKMQLLVPLDPAGGAFQLGDAFGGVHFGHRLLGAQYRVAQRSLP